MNKIQIPQELSNRQSFLNQKLEEIITDIIAVITQDCANFAQREFRARFIKNPEFASEFTTKKLVELKTRITEAAKEKALAINNLLSNNDIWLNTINEPNDARNLSGNPEVWTILASISAFVRELLVLNSFPPDSKGGYQINYKTPVMFIDGKYCPALIESYWARLAELKEVNAHIKQNHQNVMKKKLTKMWDES